MSVINWRDVLVRLSWTFAQSAIAILFADLSTLTHIATWKAAAVGGIAATLAAVKTILSHLAQPSTSEQNGG